MQRLQPGKQGVKKTMGWEGEDLLFVWQKLTSTLLVTLHFYFPFPYSNLLCFLRYLMGIMVPFKGVPQGFLVKTESLIIFSVKLIIMFYF